jgi:hypothetical protein
VNEGSRWCRVRRSCAVHEAGHAIVAERLGRRLLSVSLTRVTLAAPRTRPGSGTRRRREDLERELVILAAGAAAMDLLDCLRFGAGRDFAAACEVARELLGPDASEAVIEELVLAALVTATEILEHNRSELEDRASSYAERAE